MTDRLVLTDSPGWQIHITKERYACSTQDGRAVPVPALGYRQRVLAQRRGRNEEVDEEGNRRIELRNDNPFLHDNVD